MYRYIRTPVFPLFELATPPVFQGNHIPEGNLIVYGLAKKSFGLVGVTFRVTCGVWLTVFSYCFFFSFFRSYVPLFNL